MPVFIAGASVPEVLNPGKSPDQACILGIASRFVFLAFVQVFIANNLIDVASTLFLFITAFVLYSAVLRRLGVSHTKGFFVTGIYFTCFAAAVISIHWEYFLSLFQGTKSIAINALLVFLIANPIAYWYVRKRMQSPQRFIEHNQTQYFIRLDYRYLFAKTCEILFQQSCIIALVLMLRESGMSLWTIVLLFIILFGGAHALLFFQHTRFWAAYYFSFSLVSGIIFPQLILNVPSGYIYSFILHWLFYSLGGIGFWAYFNRQAKRIEQAS